MVCWSSFSNCWKLGIRYSNLLVTFVWLIYDQSWDICQDLYRSVQIRTETFFKALTRRRVYLVEHFLFNQFQFQNCFLTSYFSKNPGICQDLYRSVQIRRECSTWDCQRFLFHVHVIDVNRQVGVKLSYLMKFQEKMKAYHEETLKFAVPKCCSSNLIAKCKKCCYLLGIEPGTSRLPVHCSTLTPSCDNC